MVKIRITVSVQLNQSLKTIYLKQGRNMELDRVEMEEGQSLADLYEKIGLRNFDAGFAVINGQVVHDAAHPLKDGDRVALFPPLAGG